MHHIAFGKDKSFSLGTVNCGSRNSNYLLSFYFGWGKKLAIFIRIQSKNDEIN